MNKKEIVLKVLGAIEVLMGIFFLTQMASDIQLGFGLILLGLGAENLLK